MIFPSENAVPFIRVTREHTRPGTKSAPQDGWKKEECEGRKQGKQCIVCSILRYHVGYHISKW